MKLEQKQLLEELSRSMHGQALKTYLGEKYADIGDISKCTSWEDTLGRKHAISLLKEIFSFLEERKKEERTPNQYM
jgi:hypothetical protein